ncbi:hypothetical protein Lalb_Chr07g0180401 [Lupinus albus]|uniref:Uncharacterized protein n=1 Tax=Lupinus albus TaxID=3870 RepID=A0A6A4Q7U1_LUPAL|nr:hypothetical protein Lalb_Chr07g0180401 [Lupinus albus]
MRRRKWRRRYWSGSVRTAIRIRISSSLEEEEVVVSVLFERAHRPNLSRPLNRTSFMEANKQRKKMNMKQERMKKLLPCFGFGDFTIIGLIIEASEERDYFL